MRGQKKTFSTVLAAAMLTTIIAGCGSQPLSSATTAGSDKQGDTSAAEITHKFTAMVQEGTLGEFRFADREKYLPWQKLKEMFAAKGLEIEFDLIQNDQYATTLATSLASGSDLAEYVNCDVMGMSAMVNCIQNGTFIPINDLIDAGDGTAKAFLEKHNTAVKKASYTDGKLYWIPGIQESYYGGKAGSTGQGVLIRADWLKKMNMETPTTLEQFTAYLQACQDQDINGNGVKDEYYTIRLRDFTNGIAQWFGLPNDSFGMNVSEKKVYSTWEMDGVKDYFRYVSELLKKGLISQDYIACSQEVIDTAIANNQSGATNEYYMQTYVDPTVFVPDGADKANFISLMPIQGKAGIKPVSSTEPAVLSDWVHAAFTKNLKDKEAATIFLDIIYSDAYETLCSWGVEGVTYEKRDGINVLIGDGREDAWDKACISGNTIGANIWGYSVFPRIRFTDMENELMNCPEDKAEAQIKLISYEYTMPDNMKMYMNTPSPEESEILDKYESDYRSLSREIAVKLYKGEIDIDKEWDSKVIQPLKDGGMDKLLKAYQAMTERFFK